MAGGVETTVAAVVETLAALAPLGGNSNTDADAETDASTDCDCDLYDRESSSSSTSYSAVGNHGVSAAHSCPRGGTLCAIYFLDGTTCVDVVADLASSRYILPPSVAVLLFDRSAREMHACIDAGRYAPEDFSSDDEDGDEDAAAGASGEAWHGWPARLHCLVAAPREYEGASDVDEALDGTESDGVPELILTAAAALDARLPRRVGFILVSRGRAGLALQFSLIDSVSSAAAAAAPSSELPPQQPPGNQHHRPRHRTFNVARPLQAPDAFSCLPAHFVSATLSPRAARALRCAVPLATSALAARASRTRANRPLRVSLRRLAAAAKIPPRIAAHLLNLLVAGGALVSAASTSLRPSERALYTADEASVTAFHARIGTNSMAAIAAGTSSRSQPPLSPSSLDHLSLLRSYLRESLAHTENLEFLLARHVRPPVGSVPFAATATPAASAEVAPADVQLQPAFTARLALLDILFAPRAAHASPSAARQDAARLALAFLHRYAAAAAPGAVPQIPSARDAGAVSPPAGKRSRIADANAATTAATGPPVDADADYFSTLHFWSKRVGAAIDVAVTPYAAAGLGFTAEIVVRLPDGHKHRFCSGRVEKRKGTAREGAAKLACNYFNLTIRPRPPSAAMGSSGGPGKNDMTLLNELCQRQRLVLRCEFSPEPPPYACTLRVGDLEWTTPPGKRYATKAEAKAVVAMAAADALLGRRQAESPVVEAGDGTIGDSEGDGGGHLDGQDGSDPNAVAVAKFVYSCPDSAVSASDSPPSAATATAVVAATAAGARASTRTAPQRPTPRLPLPSKPDLRLPTRPTLRSSASAPTTPQRPVPRRDTPARVTATPPTAFGGIWSAATTTASAAQMPALQLQQQQQHATLAAALAGLAQQQQLQQQQQQQQSMLMMAAAAVAAASAAQSSPATATAALLAQLAQPQVTLMPPMPSVPLLLPGGFLGAPPGLQFEVNAAPVVATAVEAAAPAAVATQPPPSTPALGRKRRRSGG